MATHRRKRVTTSLLKKKMAKAKRLQRESDKAWDQYEKASRAAGFNFIGRNG
jgi:hypothetical protein